MGLADAETAIHGKWVVKSDEDNWAKWDQCSVCGYKLSAIGEAKSKKMHYCPGCGARMDGKIKVSGEEMEDMNKISPVGGVDRGVKMDRISLRNAVETPFWMAVWAMEPGRRICVEMSYSDLKIITDLIDAVRGGPEPVN